MLNLTDEQIVAFLKLGHNSLIDNTSIYVHNGGGIRPSLTSKVDANMVDILDELNKIFPVVEIKGRPFHVERTDGTYNDLYDLKVAEGYDYITLHLISTQKEKDSAPTEPHNMENTQSDYTTESEVVTNA